MCIASAYQKALGILVPFTVRPAIFEINFAENLKKKKKTEMHWMTSD